MPAAAWRQEVALGFREDVDEEIDEALSLISIGKEMGIPATEVAALHRDWRIAAFISIKSRQLIREGSRT